MSAEAAKLRADIATAEKRLADLENRPGLNAVVVHQIDKAKDVLRDMRIKLAGMETPNAVPCAHCKALVHPSWFLCRACMNDLPLKIWAALKGSIGLHHHRIISDARLQAVKDETLSYLRQHSTAIL